MKPLFLYFAMSNSYLYQLFCLKCPKIITDSRKACQGSIFFALKGESFDGNEFAAQALASGCEYAVVNRSELATDERYILVDDVLKALQDLAREHRKHLNIPVIAITGTNGKTTTKELIKSVLATKYEVCATSGNLNNHIGAPLTILEISPTTQIAIIEMGANHVGEIKFLCEIARPTCGLITNIGKAHLEGFGGFDGVKRAKKELYDFLNEHKGLIFYNEENHILTDMLKNVETNKICYSSVSQSDSRSKIRAAAPFLQADLIIGDKTFCLSTQLAGVYNFENILAAVCVGKYFNVSSEKIRTAIEAYLPQNNRSQVVRTKRNQLLLDYYNANPTSMYNSLNNFFAHIKEEKMLILGDMFELGDEATNEHTTIIDLLLSQQNLISMVVGKHFYEAAKAHPQIIAFRDVEELKKQLADNPPKDKFILIKGSRGMKLEQIREFL